jgi:CDGSH iron-sulfur domain-containing protein 3
MLRILSGTALAGLFSRLAFGMRKVLKSDKRPFEIKPQQESVWICMCGLSKNQPFCDGSHKTTRNEEDGKTYEYNAEGALRECSNSGTMHRDGQTLEFISILPEHPNPSFNGPYSEWKKLTTSQNVRRN